MSKTMDEGIFAKYVNVRVMLSIFLSILVSTAIRSILDLKTSEAYALVPFIIFLFILYMIVYAVESIPAIASWYLTNVRNQVASGQ